MRQHLESFTLSDFPEYSLEEEGLYLPESPLSPDELAMVLANTTDLIPRPNRNTERRSQ